MEGYCLDDKGEPPGQGELLQPGGPSMDGFTLALAHYRYRQQSGGSSLPWLIDAPKTGCEIVSLPFPLWFQHPYRHVLRA